MDYHLEGTFNIALYCVPIHQSFILCMPKYTADNSIFPFLVKLAYYYLDLEILLHIDFFFLTLTV